MRATLMVLALVGCAGSGPGATSPPEAVAEPVAEPDPVADPVADPDPDPVGARDPDLGARLVLLHPVMPAHGDPGRDPSARLDARLFVRGPPGWRTQMVVPLGSELDWELTAADGTRWSPMFLPPPVPRPGGPPRTSVVLPDSGEVEVGTVHGVSGFSREGSDDWQGGLPAGTYTVRVSGIDLGDGVRRSAPPLTLTVR